jgi:hypothetical protein
MLSCPKGRAAAAADTRGQCGALHYTGAGGRHPCAGEEERRRDEEKGGRDRGPRSRAVCGKAAGAWVLGGIIGGRGRGGRGGRRQRAAWGGGKECAMCKG